ncbi:unannotated protein [freshwater metagenome]|uniref:Unannotated protein n=1 Tax=freshwater metagenome TaxID=449393 RepID=A0A6J7GG00_9ZZZZ
MTDVAPPQPPARRGWLLAALLGATFLGTVSNNVVNVPLRQITDDFDVPVSQGVLVASATVVVLAVMMPITGWVSDRLGRRRTLVGAVVVLLVGTVGAALSPSLPVLVLARAVQGLGCAAVPTAVMATLAGSWPSHLRSRVMGAWGAANGIGQAVGPPVGGFVAGALGWRAVFGVLVPLTVAVLVLTVLVVPGGRPAPSRLDGVGAGTLTTGTALVIAAATAAPQPGVPGWVVLTGVVLGAGVLAAFVAGGLRRRDPFIDPRQLIEIRWLRSAVGVFVQQSSLAAVLVAVPLHLTGARDLSPGATGLVVFALPLVWAVSAPLVGLLSDRIGPRPVLRLGLVMLLLADVALAVVVGGGVGPLGAVVGTLLLTGLAVALVQTPALTGATRSPAGQRGAGLGLFNMMRFVGAALGTAAVAAAYPGHLSVLFAGCAAVALAGVGLSFAGRDVDPVRPG